MKNPLTSKERRGLTVVAAAALLCIGMGFLFRNCGSFSPKGTDVVVVDGNDSASDLSEKSERSEKSDSANGKRARREKSGKVEKKGKSTKKKKAEKSYPVRDPLSQPCD